MLITKEVEIKWHSTNIEYYTSKGYKYTKTRQPFTVKIDDLALGSHAKVKIKCDYCGKEYEVAYYHYNDYQEQAIIKKDACSKCKMKKTHETNEKIYGKPIPRQNKEISERVANSRRLNFDIVKDSFLDRGYILLTRKYKNNHQKLEYLCFTHIDKGKLEITWNDFNEGKGCWHCGVEKVTGENNPRWKGGITPISSYLRNHIQEWLKDSMKSCNYKCVITGKRFDVIHHLHPFNKIVSETMDLLNYDIKPSISDYSPEELKKIEENCLELHYKYGLGVCLTDKAHKLFHSIYGSSDTTEKQFNEFKTKYKNGEFKEIE